MMVSGGGISMPLITHRSLKVADEVWIAAALLHRENPQRSDFLVEEIVQRAEREAVFGKLRPGVYVHVVQHCVANRPPNPARYRMLFETAKNSRRLFRPGDPFDPRREGAKSVPDREDIPAKYHALLDWYINVYVRRTTKTNKLDPLLALRGSGRKLWADEHADEYVRRLREGWE
jgi:hypothetical protein